MTSTPLSLILSQPRDTLFLTLYQLDLPSLAKLCQTSSIFNSICQSPDFWSFKFLKEYGRHLSEVTGEGIHPRVAYLRAKQQELLNQQDFMKLNLIEKLTQKLVSLVKDQELTEDQIEQIEKNIRDYISYIDEALYDRTPFDELFYDFSKGETIREISYEISQILPGYDQEDEEEDEEDEGELNKIISDAFGEFLTDLQDNFFELDSIFEMLSIGKLPGFRYLTDEEFSGSKSIDVINRSLMTLILNPKVNSRLMPAVPQDEPYQPMPVNLPPPPPSLPRYISKLGAPPPLPYNLPPSEEPALPGMKIPSQVSRTPIPPPYTPPPPQTPRTPPTYPRLPPRR